jgi:hypothetical protein
MRGFKPESLCAIATDEGQYHFLAVADCMVGLFSEGNDLFRPAGGGLTPIPEEFPDPVDGLTLHETTCFNMSGKLLLEGGGVRLGDWDEMHLVSINSASLFRGPHSQKPRINSDGKGVKNRSLSRGVVADKKIKVRIKLDVALSEFLEILDRQLLNQHDSPLFFSKLV